ncbi:MAG: hypothetical protein ACLQBX_14980 [Candidatus Limnocylindrales bacterium]
MPRTAIIPDGAGVGAAEAAAALGAELAMSLEAAVTRGVAGTMMLGATAALPAEGADDDT